MVLFRKMQKQNKTGNYAYLHWPDLRLVPGRGWGLLVDVFVFERFFVLI